MEYTEYTIKFMYSQFNRKLKFVQRFLIFFSFRTLGSPRTRMAIIHQCVAYLLKEAPQIGALRLLNTLS